MRRNRVDEIPQLWQVAAGQMSLFGHRAKSKFDFDVIETDRSPGARERFYELYTVSKPGCINPNVAFDDRDRGINSEYHYAGFYSKRASLGLDLYMLYRAFVPRSIRYRKQISRTAE